MKMRRILLGTVAAAGLVVVAAAGDPIFISPVGQAQAATSVSASISIGVFYDRLSAHGDWVTFRDDYVWVPRVDASWRPYFHGHWIYVNTYGWYWVSEEPFAWAVYHYGRWAFDPDIGWHWFPGRRWAPAWVVWSYTGNEIAWAPVPPDYDDDDISVSISISSVPVHYWHVVPINVFVSIDLDRHIIRDRDHIRRVIDTGETKTVVVQNNIVVNNFIDVDIIEQKTKQEVVVHEAKAADSPEGADKADGQAITVFNAEVQEEPGAKPAKAKKVEDVAAEKKASGTLPEEPTADTAAEEPAGAAEGQATAPGQQKKTDEAVEAEEPAAVPEGQAAEGEQPVIKKKAGEAVEAEEPATVPKGQAAEGEQPVKKKKAGEAVEAEEPAAVPKGQAAEGEQPVKKKKQQQVEQPAESTEKALEAEELPPAAAEGEAAEQPQKPQKKKQACDPATEQCPQD